MYSWSAPFPFICQTGERSWTFKHWQTFPKRELDQRRCREPTARRVWTQTAQEPEAHLEVGVEVGEVEDATRSFALLHPSPAKEKDASWGNPRTEGAQGEGEERARQGEGGAETGRRALGGIRKENKKGFFPINKTVDFSTKKKKKER